MVYLAWMSRVVAVPEDKNKNSENYKHPLELYAPEIFELCEDEKDEMIAYIESRLNNTSSPRFGYYSSNDPTVTVYEKAGLTVTIERKNDKSEVSMPIKGCTNLRYVLTIVQKSGVNNSTEITLYTHKEKTLEGIYIFMKLKEKTVW